MGQIYIYNIKQLIIMHIGNILTFLLLLGKGGVYCIVCIKIHYKYTNTYYFLYNLKLLKVSYKYSITDLYSETMILNNNCA
jgi:hypothetical protein